MQTACEIKEEISIKCPQLHHFVVVMQVYLVLRSHMVNLAECWSVDYSYYFFEGVNFF
jgi:hypothetical protein